MDQDAAQPRDRSITLQQKQTLIAVYTETGNMTRAMRESGIKNPKTAYHWWHRYQDAGMDGLEPRSHARRTQERLPDPIVEEICQLRHQEPAWGRRKIATVLTQRHGQQVASPGSVEAVLRRAGLWEPSTQPVDAAPLPSRSTEWFQSGRIDYEGLLAVVQTGIRLSVHSDAAAAARVLHYQVWQPLEAEPSLWGRLLTTPRIGSWLLASRLHLGHSLMNSGHWRQAAHYLQQTILWMGERALEPHQHVPEEASPLVSLRWDDVWLGCYQHMGLVLGKSNIDVGLAYLQTALGAMTRRHRTVMTSNAGMRGDLERDLAYLKLRLPRMPEAEIRDHLRHAQQNAEDTGTPGMLAFVHFAWAKLSDRLAREAGVREPRIRQQQRNQMEQSIHQALELMEKEQDDRALRLTLCFVDAAQLAHAHGMPVEGQWVKRAAEYCLAYGYGGQARQLLAIPGVGRWLSEEVQRQMVGLWRSD